METTGRLYLLSADGEVDLKRPSHRGGHITTMKLVSCWMATPHLLKGQWNRLSMTRMMMVILVMKMGKGYEICQWEIFK
jgi:hypothetical protein